MYNAAGKVARALAGRIVAGLNAGEARHGRMGWLLLVSGMVVPVWAGDGFCLSVNVFLAFFFNVLTLYFCLGLKESSRYFSSIQLALIAGDEAGAGRKLGEWRGKKAAAPELPEIGPAGAVFLPAGGLFCQGWQVDGNAFCCCRQF